MVSTHLKNISQIWIISPNRDEILKKKMKPPPSFLLTKKKWGGPTTLQKPPHNTPVPPSVKVAPGKPVFGPREVGVFPFRNLENRPYQGTTSKTLGHVWDVFCCEVCNPITRIFVKGAAFLWWKWIATILIPRSWTTLILKTFHSVDPEKISFSLQDGLIVIHENTFLGC